MKAKERWQDATGKEASEARSGKRGLFLFFLPPYSPHLNIAETLWRILKGKWNQPADYASADTLFYAVNRALAALGTISKINFSVSA